MLNFSFLSLALLQFVNIVIVQIFDEILVNAADNKQRDKKMDTIKIDIKPEENMIKVSDVSFLLTTFPHIIICLLSHGQYSMYGNFFGYFQVYNNGKGIPITWHKDENMYVPTMIFGHLLTSSNFNDDDQKVTGGRNGFGAKLCNVFSDKFTVETACKESKKEFKQSWSKNMSKAGEAKIKPLADKDFTKITYVPDLTKFKMESMDKVNT